MWIDREKTMDTTRRGDPCGRPSILHRKMESMRAIRLRSPFGECEICSKFHRATARVAPTRRYTWRRPTSHQRGGLKERNIWTNT